MGKGQSLGELLKAGRVAKGISLRDVEKEVDISNAYLSQLEGNKIKQPSPKVLHMLAVLYEISYPKLMMMAGYPVPEGSNHSSGVAARFGDVTPAEERELLNYLAFLRAKHGS